MTNLHCPTCSTHLDAHEPGPCLREWAASVFGWPEHDWAENMYRCRRCMRDKTFIMEAEQEEGCHAWQPDTRIEDAWLLLAAEHHVVVRWAEHIGAQDAPLAILRAAMKGRLG